MLLQVITLNQITGINYNCFIIFLQEKETIAEEDTSEDVLNQTFKKPKYV